MPLTLAIHAVVVRPEARDRVHERRVGDDHAVFECDLGHRALSSKVRVRAVLHRVDLVPATLQCSAVRVPGGVRDVDATDLPALIALGFLVRCAGRRHRFDFSRRVPARWSIVSVGCCSYSMAADQQACCGCQSSERCDSQ